MKRITIHFAGKIAQEDFNNDSKRRMLLELMIHKVWELFPKLYTWGCNSTLCTAFFVGSNEEVLCLEKYLNLQEIGFEDSEL